MFIAGSFRPPVGKKILASKSFYTEHTNFHFGNKYVQLIYALHTHFWTKYIEIEAKTWLYHLPVTHNELTIT